MELASGVIMQAYVCSSIVKEGDERELGGGVGEEERSCSAATPHTIFLIAPPSFGKRRGNAALLCL
jgi:hypothetical protein